MTREKQKRQREPDGHRKPIGDHRIQAPRPSVPVSEVQAAIGSMKQCPMSRAIPGSGHDKGRLLLVQDLAVYGEDCLFLNVYVPLGTRLGRDERRVFVHIHGRG